ncbi:PAS domain-containing protein [Thalassobius sp. Cn5-15]|uniref:PAS domain-containing protein n=1 Tax=Thalassobius sp. Cn5-15 TaxID=2917763 RepID=UPI001EF19A9D|nr:PAS domain-containing protein [Thalassobius sp. Cn5-15]MCG7492262.1 PAS domain-containing protein [Thalassobius sp. Cn5-15]
MSKAAAQGAATDRGNVLEMTPFLNSGHFPELAELDAYWHAKRRADRGTAGLPARADIDPRGIVGALANSFILERLEEGMFRLRLAGHALNDLMGMEVRGMPPTALFSNRHQGELNTLCEAVCTQPALLQAEVSATRGPGKPALEGRLALWPLLDDQGYTTRLLGGISYRGSVGAAPRSLQLVSHRLRMLETASILPPPLPAPYKTNTATSADPTPEGFAEGPLPFGHATTRDASKRPSHLRLVSETKPKT